MEDIIRLFNANETNFDHNETILTDVLSFESEVEENGISYCEMTCPLDDRIEEGKILKAPTPIGEQLFRIIKINKNLPAMTLYVYGRHISYDLLNNMLLNIRPTSTTQQNALNAILAGTEYPHPFTATSDVPGLNTANYVRINPIQAIMGAENSTLNLWGGFLRRDNFLIKVLATSPDKGYEVRFGKNLLGVDEELDMTEVVTRLYPTVVIQEPTVTALPEKYVDSPLINSYPKPIIKEYRITLTDEEKLLTLAQIYALMRARCAEQWTLKADQPKVNYKVDFVELRKTEQYKNFAVLEELDISDTVWAYVSPLNLNMSARMIKYRHDGLNDRYISMELGNFKPKLTSQKAEFVKLVKDATKDLTDGVITAMLKDAVDRIQGNLGGNVVTITANGKPVATAYMDTADVATANKYVILNNMGIAFGVNGLSNPPELAIDINGSVVGNSAFFRSITTNLIQSELGSDLVLSSNTSIKLLANSLVTIDESGLNVGINGNSTNSQMSYDGLKVYDGTKERAYFGESGSHVPNLQVDFISGNVLNTIESGVLTYEIGIGYSYPTITSAINALFPSTKRVLRDTIIQFIVKTSIIDIPAMSGFTGHGSIYIKVDSGAIINGYILIENNSVAVFVLGNNGKGTIKTTSGTSNIYVNNTNYVDISNFNLDGYGLTQLACVYAVNGSNVRVRNCDMVRANHALYVKDGAMIIAYDNIGGGVGSELNWYMHATAGGIGYTNGSVPVGTQGSVTTFYGWINGVVGTPTPSVYSPPAVTPTPFAAVFKPLQKKTYIRGTSTVAGSYGERAAQGKSSAGSIWTEGRITFGTDVANYFAGGTNIAVQMRLHRYDSSHGLSAACKPDPDNFTPTTWPTGGALQGGWSEWATISSAEFSTTANKEFRFYSSTLDSGYAIWDDAEVKVTVTKNV